MVGPRQFDGLNWAPDFVSRYRQAAESVARSRLAISNGNWFSDPHLLR